MLNNFRNKIIDFLESKEDIPIVSAIAAGLYPLLYYYNSNFTLVNSWEQFGFFLIWYILVPIVVFYLVYRIFKKFDKKQKFLPFVIPILNIVAFVFFVVITIYGLNVNMLIIATIVALLSALLLSKHINRIVVFQFLLAAFVSVKLIPDIYKILNYSSKWTSQPDGIESVEFKKKPNIYIIQPDGYANFSHLKMAPYNYDNSNFEMFLNKRDFKLYEGYRSNYISTLSSNSSMFAMKHHYYNNSITGNELYGTRELIVGDNPVISILKNNDYKNFLLLERSYLLVNRPKIRYDYCNINYDEVSFLARGFEINKTIVNELSTLIDNNTHTNNFYFVRIMRPSHVSVNESESKGVEMEREFYLSELQRANVTLEEVINTINKKDKNSLIVIASDHGGYVGLSYSQEIKVKQTNKDIIQSIYTSALAIKWPDGAPDFDYKFKTSVNLFRILFSYLGDEKSYLNHLEEDKSYAAIRDGATVGIYEYINGSGDVVFNVHDPQ